MLPQESKSADCDKIAAERARRQFHCPALISDVKHFEMNQHG
jgi:hypothetical protein